MCTQIHRFYPYKPVKIGPLSLTASSAEEVYKAILGCSLSKLVLFSPLEPFILCLFNPFSYYCYIITLQCVFAYLVTWLSTPQITAAQLDNLNQIFSRILQSPRLQKIVKFL